MPTPAPVDLTVEQTDSLIRIVGEANALVDDDVRAGYETDWTRRWSGHCSMVVRPADRDQVAAALRYCNGERISVIPQGGNTGLVGGGVPRPAGVEARPAVVLSTERLRAVGDVDAQALQVTLGAGVTVAEWQEVARQHGLDTPIDFASRDSATIGGAIATNAGGSRVLRFGTMRQQVLGVEAVLADGRMIGSLSGLPKETVGLHWPSLLAGSEGTFGIVSAARLRLVPLYEHRTTMLLSMASLDAALTMLQTLRHRVETLDAIEIILPAAIDLVARHLARRPPVATGAAILLVECAAHSNPTEALVAAIATAGGIVDSAVATDGVARRELVQFRDRITESLAAEATRIDTPIYKLDVAVPVGSIERLVDVAERAATSTGSRLVPFGHLAEGNLHLNYLGASDGSRIADIVLATVADMGGTISAEHGVGIAKTAWLPLIRNNAELAGQAAIKRALDPNGILNPGVLETPGTFGV